MADDPKFLTIRFDGGRFRDHTAPVQTLGELVTIERLLAITAKRLYLEAHPERKRTPKGFADAARLILTATERNCWTAELAHAPPTWKSDDPADHEIFEQARDTIMDVIGSVAAGTTPPLLLADEADRLLSRLGALLRNDEVVTFKNPAAREASVDFQTRMRLARRAGVALVVEKELEGEVTAVDASNHTFEVSTPDGDVEIRLTPDRRDEVLKALDERPVAVVRFGCRLSLATKKVEEIMYLEFDDHPRADEIRLAWRRLEELKAITAGWLDGEGAIISWTAIGWAREVVARVLANEAAVAKPGLFPTPEGGVRAEWFSADRTLRLEFRDDDVCRASSLILGGEARDQEYGLRSKESSARIAKEVGSFLGGAGGDGDG